MLKARAGKLRPSNRVPGRSNLKYVLSVWIDHRDTSNADGMIFSLRESLRRQCVQHIQALLREANRGSVILGP